ncbi:hypothetical protein M427DRAFT_323977 [Gonapodya prolifera JEL478]|uniref:Uncharacterized protein n=1 Tax=Gonapodya prolifera (strain JEL478) TaxID=1344416 RepID=A0A139AG15_GONPJ|nr:hypothetical protein M427DRAFT_323977 [Gonapodya prolifera JEL478]|eukprot:KXS15353.1 hypothetical protein M427DRAFT_323977 [Gonapodya prolifera JEL478]
MGCGGKFTSWDGKMGDAPNKYGQLDIDLGGGAFVITLPEKWEHVRVWFTVLPHVEIVRLLLAYGARVTNTELDAARKNTNSEFLKILESHQRSRIPLTAMITPRTTSRSPSPLERPSDMLLAPVGDLATRVTAAVARAAAAEEQVRVMARKLAEVESSAAVLKTRNAELEKTVSDTLNEVATVRSRNSEVEQELSSLRNRASSSPNGILFPGLNPKSSGDGLLQVNGQERHVSMDRTARSRVASRHCDSTLLN